MAIADRILTLRRRGFSAAAIAAILDTDPETVASISLNDSDAAAASVPSIADIQARVDALEVVTTPPRSSAGGVINGVTVSYGTVAGRTVAVFNKRGTGTATALFGWPAATRGNFIDQITADGADSAAWLNDIGTHDIWEVGFPTPGGQWSVLTHTQFEADLVAAGLPAWGDVTKVPAWVP